MPEYFIIVSGNVVDGLSFFGPFTDANVAGDWARDETGEEWSCVKLSEVEGYTLGREEKD